jgi:hypothetical protein
MMRICVKPDVLFLKFQLLTSHHSGFPRGGTNNDEEDEDESTVMATDAFMDNEDDEEHQYDLENFPRSRPCSPRRVYPGTRSWRGSQNGLIPKCPAPCCRARSLSF